MMEHDEFDPWNDENSSVILIHGTAKLTTLLVLCWELWQWYHVEIEFQLYSDATL
jgi:hypothetical protein